MIAINGRGRLIDLDMAQGRDDSGTWLAMKIVSLHPRSCFVSCFRQTESFALQGTWPFMSTRLLTTYEFKIHELRDDLESLWFVLLYEALHFVRHNSPFGIHMGDIFNQVSVCGKNGMLTGGIGKRDLYFERGALMSRILAFESKPFTALVRQVYQLFQSLIAHYQELDNKKDPEEEDPNTPIVRKLNSCAEMERLFREALDTEGWPESCDKVEDQYSTSKQETVALSNVNNPVRQLGKPSGMKRKREEENPPVFEFENKRIKVNPLWKWIWSGYTRLVGG
jgi:hypothetical protein